MIDLPAARALAARARESTSDGLTAREALPKIVDALAGEAEAARSLRVVPRSLEPFISREHHNPARIRALLIALGWKLLKQHEECSEWTKPGVTRPGWLGDGSIVMVLDSTRFSDYQHHVAMMAADLAGMHGMGELAVLAGIEAQDA